MDISTLNRRTSNYKRTLYLENENESNFIIWLNNFVTDPPIAIPINTLIDEQYDFFVVDPKISHLIIKPRPISNSGRPPFKFPWVLVGCLNQYNVEDSSISLGVETIEAVTIKSFQVADQLQITISTGYKLIEDLFLPRLLEAIEKVYPGSILGDTPPEKPVHLKVEEITDIDKLILRWVDRERYAPGQDLDTFLSEDPVGNKFSSDQFNKVLRKAGGRGLIKKSGRRWVNA